MAREVSAVIYSTGLWLVVVGLVMMGSASGNIQVPLMTKIFACEGDRVPIMAAVQHAEGDIESSKIYKNGDGIYNRMVKEGNKPPVLTPADKVEYVNPLGIYIRDVTVNDSGPYEIHAVFRNGATAWLRFNITVFSGCPDKREFYDPSIRYGVDIDPQQPLPDTRVIQVDDTYKLLTLNVSIPKSNLPATCTIKGRGRTITAEGAGDTAVYCLATFHNVGHDNYTVLVDLEHLMLQAPSKTHIAVLIAGESKHAPSSGDPDNDAAFSLSNTAIIVIAVIATIVFLATLLTVCVVCWKKRSRNGVPHDQEKSENDKNAQKNQGNASPDAAFSPVQVELDDPSIDDTRQPLVGATGARPVGGQGMPHHSRAESDSYV